MMFAQRAISLLISLSVLSLMPLTALADEALLLSEGTPIRLKLVDTISSGKNKEGDTINFQVADDVLAEDGVTVLIKAGTPAWGTVAEVEKRGMIGKKGEMSVTVDGTKAVDGKRVPLRANLSREGRSKMGTSIALAALVPGGLLWLLMKGKDATLPAGTQISAYIDRNVKVAVKPVDKEPVTAVAQPSEDAKPIPEYLQKYMESDQSTDALKALEQLKQQGLLSAEEYEAKKKALSEKAK